MGDSGSSRRMVVPTTSTSKSSTNKSLVASSGSPKPSLVASPAKIISPKTLDGMLFLRNANFWGSTAPIVFFLLKVASLEIVRRFSRARCPFVWRGLQALHLLCYPPFKWLQRWAPFRILINGMQKLSRPLLFLSIATAFTDDLEYCEKSNDNLDESQPSSELPPESTSDTRIITGEPEAPVPENWMSQLLKELEKQGVTIPERIDEDELHRFYTAANGDLSCLLSSVKKTIRWRETYAILSAQELEVEDGGNWEITLMISKFLLFRISSILASHMFVLALSVSQMEHGVLHLVNAEDPRITVLMDCEGVLRPSTRSKVRFEGETYIKMLTEYLETVPACLGGKCTCDKCQMLPVGWHCPRSPTIETIMRELSFTSTDEDAIREQHANDLPVDGGCEQIIRTAIVGILMVWIFIALLSTMFDQDGRFSFS
ncbi:hypothetical protein ACLOJK_028168 [Asimina triloba]